jgi:hypothetical protein
MKVTIKPEKAPFYNPLSRFIYYLFMVTLYSSYELNMTAFPKGMVASG